MGLLDRIQAKIELFRLEQRYTRRRHRRSTFVSTAIYVDGEYVYQTPTSTGSTTNTSATAVADADAAPVPAPAAADKPGKRLNRWSSMPGFGSLSGSPAARDWRE